MTHAEAGKAGEVLRRWLESSVLPGFGDRILPADLEVARASAGLHMPTRPDRDAYIAATALAHDLIVLTRNVDEFAPSGVPLINPWR